jgi:hypothetical protein
MEPLAGNLLVQQMAFTADSRRLLVKDGNQVKLWDLASRQLVLSFSPARGATLNSFKLSPDGHRLLLGGIEVVDPTRNQTIFTVLDATPLEEKK